MSKVPWLNCAERYDRSHTFHYINAPYWQTTGYGVDFPFENYEWMADFMRDTFLIDERCFMFFESWAN